MFDETLSSKTVCLLWITALAQPFPARSQNPSNDKKDSPAVQSTETIKWTFGGADAGTTNYQAHPDGKFESVTDLHIAGMVLKSSLTGRLVEGAITEFEMVSSQAGTEIKISAKEGKARITAGKQTRDVDYKPSKVFLLTFIPFSPKP